MIRSLWIAKTGLDAQQTNLDVIANNLANIGTNGFKRSKAVFEDLLYQTSREPGAASSQQTQYPSGLQIGTGSRITETIRTHTQGNLQQSGNALDVAINGNGFFQVTMPDGTVAYTRDGALHSDANGQLVNANGSPISPAVTIPQNTISITIGQDGTVSALVSGSAATTQIGTIQLASFINPAGLKSLGGNLYSETSASGTPNSGTPGVNGLGVLNQGYVETSNVNAVEELVSMIQTQRAYEINSKAIQTSDQMLARLTQL